MIQYATGKSTTRKAPKLLHTRNNQKKQNGLDTVNVLQCSIPCAGMWPGTDRRVTHADRRIMQGEKWRSGVESEKGHLHKQTVLGSVRVKIQKRFTS